MYLFKILIFKFLNIIFSKTVFLNHWDFLCYLRSVPCGDTDFCFSIIENSIFYWRFSWALLRNLIKTRASSFWVFYLNLCSKNNRSTMMGLEKTVVLCNFRLNIYKWVYTLEKVTVTINIYWLERFSVPRSIMQVSLISPIAVPIVFFLDGK